MRIARGGVVMGLKDMLLDEDCNRCEGDVPEDKRLKVPKETVGAKELPGLLKAQSTVAGAASISVDEGSSSDAIDELRELLGD